jgi:choline dehydrogenase
VAYDEIVVGSGSSGTVVATRLSEDPDRHVLLIEAGPDYTSLDSTPSNLLNGFQLARDHDWGLSAEMVEGRSVAYTRGKVTGGSSAVNACLALRGIPADYDAWNQLGNSEWSWQQVQPVFRAIERDADVDNEHHGTSGPTLVRRYPIDELTPTQRTFYEACREFGFPETNDHNHPKSTGIGTGPWNISPEGVRISTAIAYLYPARSRPNLTIRPDTLVDRVIFEGNRAIGVEVLTNGVRERILGGRVTLSGGAIGTPAILLRSGIGATSDLKAVEIGQRVNLPGVGQNLVDHAGVGFNWTSPPGLVAEDSPFVQTVCRFTAPDSSAFNDMQVMLFQALPQPALRLRALLMKPLSSGSVRLRSNDPHVAPDIQLNLLSAPEDVRRMQEGIRILGELIHLPPLVELGTTRITLDDGEVLEAGKLEKLITKDEWVTTYARRAVRHYVHPVGSARIGPPNDDLAVVDQHCRVHGISHLRVADASVMPSIPSANTNFPCIMIGERVAAWMRWERD